MLSLSAAARWVVMRLPEDLAESPLSQLLFRLISSTEDRKYANIYPRANELLNLISAEKSGVEPELKVVLSRLLQKFIGKVDQQRPLRSIDSSICLLFRVVSHPYL